MTRHWVSLHSSTRFMWLACRNVGRATELSFPPAAIVKNNVCRLREWFVIYREFRFWWLSLPFQVGEACLFEDHLTVLNQLSHPWLIQEECEELIWGRRQVMGWRRHCLSYMCWALMCWVWYSPLLEWECMHTSQKEKKRKVSKQGHLNLGLPDK